MVTNNKPRGCDVERYRAIVRSWVGCPDERASFVVYDGFLFGRSKPFLRAPKAGHPVIGVGAAWLRAAGVPVEALNEKRQEGKNHEEQAQG